MEYSSTVSGSLVNDMLLKAKTTEEAKEALAREYGVSRCLLYQLVKE